MYAENTKRIGELLLRHLPPSNGRLVIVGPAAESIVEWIHSRLGDVRMYAIADPTAMSSFFAPENSPTEPCTTICFVDAFCGVDKWQQSETLAQARDQLIYCVLHLELKADSSDGDHDDISRWKLSDSLSLGYRRTAAGTFGQSAWELYEYNLFNYKKTPDWLNASHWSNPQHWDHFRW